MSFARFGPESDVYLFLSVNGRLECCGCSLSDKWTYQTTDALLAHLDAHEAAGHKVPASARERLIEDRAENDDYIRYLKERADAC